MSDHIKSDFISELYEIRDVDDFVSFLFDNDISKLRCQLRKTVLGNPVSVTRSQEIGELISLVFDHPLLKSDFNLTCKLLVHSNYILAHALTELSGAKLSWDSYNKILDQQIYQGKETHIAVAVAEVLHGLLVSNNNWIFQNYAGQNSSASFCVFITYCVDRKILTPCELSKMITSEILCCSIRDIIYDDIELINYLCKDVFNIEFDQSIKKLLPRLYQSDVYRLCLNAFKQVELGNLSHTFLNNLEQNVIDFQKIVTGEIKISPRCVDFFACLKVTKLLHDEKNVKLLEVAGNYQYLIIIFRELLTPYDTSLLNTENNANAYNNFVSILSNSKHAEKMCALLRRLNKKSLLNQVVFENLIKNL